MRRWLKTLASKPSKVIFLRRVSGASMAPTYKNDQLVIATSLLKARKGRVVIAKHGSNEVIKRVDHIKDSRVDLVGDNLNQHHNLTIEASQITGVVI